MTSGHEFLDHTADVQVHAWAPSMKSLFEDIGLILMGIIVEGDNVSPSRAIEVNVEAEDWESLLFDWLGEILFYFDSELFVIGEIDVHSLEKKGENVYSITSTFKGETFQGGKHVPGTEVKAITYSYMELAKQDDGLFHLKIIFDI
ncbi:MAG: archease [Promethearchaeota archaeon]